MIFNNGSNGIQSRQSDLYKIQSQLSSGRRIQTPEDDPIGASEVLQISQSNAVNSQYLENQANAQGQLAYVESTLGGIGDALLRVTELATKGEGVSLSAAERGMIATELKGLLANLIGLANTQDGTGKYIFAGYNSSIKPFSAVTQSTPPPVYGLGNTYVTYSGDAGKPTLSVTASNEMAVSENGLDVFMLVKNASGSVSGKSLFDTVQNLINNMDGSLTYDSAKQATAIVEVRSLISHISTVRASVGARQNSLDGLTSAGEDVKYLYDSRLAELQNLDYTAAISEYANVKMQLEAAQLSFKQSSQLSLFSLL
jgi:flagellar hook-associated protein 3 FlgL